MLGAFSIHACVVKSGVGVVGCRVRYGTTGKPKAVPSTSSLSLPLGDRNKALAEANPWQQKKVTTSKKKKHFHTGL